MSPLFEWINPWYLVVIMVLLYIVQIVLSLKYFKRGFEEGCLYNFTVTLQRLEKSRVASLDKNGNFVTYNPELDMFTKGVTVNMLVAAAKSIPSKVYKS